MRLQTLLLLAIQLSSSAALAAGAPANQPLPTPQEVHQHFDAGKYQDVLREISRLDDSRDWADKKLDRFDLLMLKADAALHLKQTSVAQATYAAAAKEAPDKKSEALAATMGLLMRQSPGLKYTPKPSKDKDAPKPEAIDILDPDSRARALKSMLADAMENIHPKLEEAAQATSLTTIMKILPLVAQVRTMELGVNQSDDWTRDFRDGLGKHARELMVNAMYTSKAHVETIRRSANTPVPLYRRAGNSKNPVLDTGIEPGSFRARGLDKNEARDLRDLIATCEKLPGAAKELGEATGLGADYFKDPVAEAPPIIARARRVLEGDFSTVRDDP